MFEVPWACGFAVSALQSISCWCGFQFEVPCTDVTSAEFVPLVGLLLPV